MPTKAVTVTGDALGAPAGQDAAGGQGMLGAVVQMYNCLLRLIENAAYTAAGIAMGTTTTTVKTVNTLTYTIAGVFKSKVATDNFWTVAMLQAAAGFAVIPIGSRAVFLFLIDASGVGSVIQGPVGTTDALATIPADTIVEDKCIAGTCKVVCTAANFTPGTDAWNKGSVTFTFGDGYDASMVGAARLNTRV